MNIILLASGQGSRLRPETEDYPKPLVKVNSNKRIFDYFLDATKRIKSEFEIIIATGYKYKNFDHLNLTTIYNPFYETTNMLFGIWFTINKIKSLEKDLIVSYGDIIFPPNTFEKLREKDEITIVTDSDWESNYIGRTSHGYNECEKCIVDNNGYLLVASKNLPKEFIKYKEFIGVIYIPKRFINVIKDHLNTIFASEEEFDNKFAFSDTLRKAYLTDFLSYLVINNFKIKCLEVIGKWYEIDTIQDLEKIRGLKNV
jgi:choline kinase